MNDPKIKIDWKIPIILCIVCMLSTAVLALTYSIARPRIDYIEEQQLQALLSTVLDAGHFQKLSEKDPGLFSDLNSCAEEIYIGSSEGNVLGSIFLLSAKGYGGDIKFLVGVSGNRITGVTIHSHLETPGLGTRIESYSFLNQFRNTLFSKTDYDTITGATVSSRAVIDELVLNTRMALSQLEQKDMVKLGLSESNSNIATGLGKND